jgi:hypothetical protein
VDIYTEDRQRWILHYLCEGDYYSLHALLLVEWIDGGELVMREKTTKSSKVSMTSAINFVDADRNDSLASN